LGLAASVGAPVAGIEHHPNRAEQNAQIHLQAAMAGVVKIELDAFAIAEVVPARDLPEPGQPRAHRQHLLHALAVAGQFLLHNRTGANNAHLTPKHIQELGQFIKAGSAQETA